MIIDWKLDHRNARLYLVVDAETGEYIRCYRADDEKGVFWRYKRNVIGKPYTVPDELTGEPVLAVERVERKIRIVPEAGVFAQ